MGEVREKITLANTGDLINAGRGCIQESEVRQMTVDAIRDRALRKRPFD